MLSFILDRTFYLQLAYPYSATRSLPSRSKEGVRKDATPINITNIPVITKASGTPITSAIHPVKISPTTLGNADILKYSENTRPNIWGATSVWRIAVKAAEKTASAIPDNIVARIRPINQLEGIHPHTTKESPNIKCIAFTNITFRVLTLPALSNVPPINIPIPHTISTTLISHFPPP